jgi:hypothetical protein
VKRSSSAELFYQERTNCITRPLVFLLVDRAAVILAGILNPIDKRLINNNGMQARVFHKWKTCVRLLFPLIMAESGMKQSGEPMHQESELEAPIWSVISFDRCEAAGLTYPEAVQKLNELEAKKVSGLCIVTDDAAEHVAG